MCDGTLYESAQVVKTSHFPFHEQLQKPKSANIGCSYESAWSSTCTQARVFYVVVSSSLRMGAVMGQPLRHASETVVASLA